MKGFLKGIFLGIALITVNKFCCHAFDGFKTDYITLEIVGAIVFFVITTAFLVSKNIPELLCCGFCGLFVMFFGELFVGIRIGDAFDSLDVYLGGFWGSMAALAVSVILTLKRLSLTDLFHKENIDMEKNLKAKLLSYAIISAVGFSYLVMPENAGISVPVFTLIQFGYLWFIVPDRKRLVLFIPIFIMSLNCFWSASDIWRIPNLLVSALLYACMFMKFDFKSDKLGYIADAVIRLLAPFARFDIPFKWILDLSNDKAPTVKRIALALIIAIPCGIMLILVLSNADMVFSMKTEKLMSNIFETLSLHTLFVIICGIFAGLYLFGAIHSSYESIVNKTTRELQFKGDLIIINILLSVILFVYTLFVVIQFKYLFAGSMLPEGLTYTTYARKGFFELLALTGVNIAVILTVIKLTKNQDGRWAFLARILCHYLCVVTIILLVSSFYRMMLYTDSDGLTRLRFFVMGFLVFEAIGLLITFFYIAKPKFNITLIYITLALTYYTILNIVPADNIIARNQIDKYLSNEREDIAYVFTLSADAAPAMEYLIANTEEEGIKENIRMFLKDRTTFDIPERWQRYNLSVERAKKL